MKTVDWYLHTKSDIDSLGLAQKNACESSKVCYLCIHEMTLQRVAFLRNKKVLPFGKR